MAFGVNDDAEYSRFPFGTLFRRNLSLIGTAYPDLAFHLPAAVAAFRVAAASANSAADAANAAPAANAADGGAAWAACTAPAFVAGYPTPCVRCLHAEIVTDRASLWELPTAMAAAGDLAAGVKVVLHADD